MIKPGLFVRKPTESVLQRLSPVRVISAHGIPVGLKMLVWCVLAIAGGWVSGQSSRAWGQSSRAWGQSSQQNRPQQAESQSLANGQQALTAELGVDGKFRSGCWTQLVLKNTSANQSYELQTLDGDAVRYKYRIQTGSESIADGDFRTYFPAGPPGAPLEIFAVDEDGQLSENAVFRNRLFEGLVDVDRPWVVALGSAIGLDQLGRNELLGVSGSIDVSVLKNAIDVPDRWIGFDGVDYVVIGGDSVELLQSIRPEQHKAISDWILGGGHLFLTLGSRGPEIMAAAPWLREWLVGDGKVELVTAEPEAIETFVSARSPVQSFAAMRLPSSTSSGVESLTVLAGRSSDRKALPLLTLHSVGLGKVTAFAGGFDESPLQKWAQFGDFIDRAIPDLLPKKRKRGERPVAADVRYSEVAGQVRINLDRFASARGARFSLIAAMVLTLVGLIGPLDYFLVNRWLGRPLLGWISFPLTIAAFSAAIVMWNRQAAPISVNQITFLDMDNQSGLGRGFSWAQLYSDQAERFDLEFVANDSSEGEIDRAASATGIVTGPWGYAGRAFGGIEVAGEDIRLPAYQLVTDFGRDGQQATDPISSRLTGVPLAPKSSRGLAGRWRFSGNQIGNVDLRRRVGSDLLVGSLLNPFDRDLLDGYLIYRNLAYIMPTRVPVGSRISAIENLPTKNFRWRLNRRQTAEDSIRSEPWNPADDENLERLMEIVMFYGAAGGSNYVGLNDRVVGDLDLSDSLALDNAILVGRFEESPVSLDVAGKVAAADEVDSLTYVRMIIPIPNRASASGYGRN